MEAKMKMNRNMTDKFQSVALRGLLAVGLLGAFQTPGSNPPTLPTVTITATDPNAAEVGPVNGKFTVSRTGATSVDLVVNFQTPTGSAQIATDYQLLDGSYYPRGNYYYVTIPTGASTAEVRVEPILDTDCSEGNETVEITLLGGDYWLGAQTTATVTIADAPDSDGDGMADWWEIEHFSDLTQGAERNDDGDRLNNLQEYLHGTDPGQADCTADATGATALQVYTPLK